MFTAGVVSIFEDIFVLLGILVIMLNMNWRLALITFAVLPLIFYATSIFRRKVRESYRRIRIAIARINAYLQEHVTGIVVLQLFNREKKSYERFEKINRTHMDAFKDAIMAHAVYYPVVEVLSATAIACVVWFGGNQVIRNLVTLGVLVAFMQYAQRFFRPIQDLSEKYNILQSAMASSERIFKLLDTPPRSSRPHRRRCPQGRAASSSTTCGSPIAPWRRPRKKPPARARSSRPAADGNGDLALEYDWVLRDVSFTIEPGRDGRHRRPHRRGQDHDHLAAAALLRRAEGRHPHRRRRYPRHGPERSAAALRRGAAGSVPVLRHGGRQHSPGLALDRGRRRSRMPPSRSTSPTSFARCPAASREEVRERGSTLSTGQKQLISFARALAHNPKILILDEATSSVDTETEFRVREALTRMVEGRTSIIIAHRLSTIQRANKIIVMHKGKVREIGSHQQLLANRGIYWKLYQLQYKDQEIPAAILAGEVTGQASASRPTTKNVMPARHSWRLLNPD